MADEKYIVSGNGAGDSYQKDAAQALNRKWDERALHGRITGWLTLSVLAAALGSSFIFGYNIGVINACGSKIQRWIANTQNWLPANYTNDPEGAKSLGDKDFLDNLFPEDKKKLIFIFSWVGGIFPLGGMFGGLATGFVADRFGRKGGMLINNILTFAAGIIMFISVKFTDSYLVLILGRFLIGVNCGLNSGLAPMYLTEISPVNYRGSLGSVNQLMVTLSILVANILGLGIFLGTATLWPYLLLFTIVPSIWQLITLPMCPESPKYLLITKGQHDNARNALVKLRQKSDVDAEISKMQAEADKIKSEPAVKFMDMFRVPILRWALFLAVMMMLSQQLSGINATMFYSNEIFEKDAKLSTSAATSATLGVMIVNVLMTFVSTVLVDKAGRRTLQLIGLIGMLISTVLLVISLDLSGREYEWAAYLAIVFVILFVVSFATGPGSIPWFYVSECFEQGARGNANSVAVGVNWFAAFLVTFTFPPIQAAITKYSFLIFTFLLSIFVAFTFKYIPETKNKSIDQVLSELQRFVD